MRRHVWPGLGAWIWHRHSANGHGTCLGPQPGADYLAPWPAANPASFLGLITSAARIAPGPMSPILVAVTSCVQCLRDLDRVGPRLEKEAHGAAAPEVVSRPRRGPAHGLAAAFCDSSAGPGAGRRGRGGRRQRDPAGACRCRRPRGEPGVGITAGSGDRSSRRHDPEPLARRSGELRAPGPLERPRDWSLPVQIRGPPPPRADGTADPASARRPRRRAEGHYRLGTWGPRRARIHRRRRSGTPLCAGDVFGSWMTPDGAPRAQLDSWRPMRSTNAHTAFAGAACLLDFGAGHLPSCGVHRRSCRLDARTNLNVLQWPLNRDQGLASHNPQVS